MVRSRIFPLMALALSCAVSANGCLKHTELPSKVEEVSIQQYSEVIVLLRLRNVVEGKPRETIRLAEKNKGYGYGFTVDVGRLDPGQSPDSTFYTTLISPSSEGRRKGWIYYILPPGSYYLTVYDIENKGSLAPGFLLSVSGEKKLVYAGTLDIVCKPGFWSWNPPEQCSGVSLTDERDAAQALAQVHFAQFGSISTSLMSKSDKAMAASQRHTSRSDGAKAASQRHTIFPMGYVTAGTKDIGTPGWIKRGTARTPWKISDGSLRFLMGASPVGTAAAMTYVLYLPLAYAGAAIINKSTEKSAEKKWQSCLQELAREIGDINPAAALQRKLDEELKKFRDSKTVALPPEGDTFQESGWRGLKSLLQVEVQRIQIKECQERGFLCIEVSIRARLWKVPEKSLYFDKVLVYTNNLLDERIPSEIQVPESSPCRKMDVYCGPQGEQILRDEVAAAISNLVEQLLIELSVT